VIVLGTVLERIEISLSEQESKDFPRVCEEKQKSDRESAEKLRILQITTPSP
jgi:hypothetical protein